MISFFLFTLLLYIAALLEGSMTTFPLVLDVLLFAFLLFHQFSDWRSTSLLVCACIAGLLVDTIVLGNIGTRSIYYVIFLFLLFLYEGKFEVETVAFVALFSFFGGFFYLLLLGYTSVLAVSLLNVVLCVGIFLIIKVIVKPKSSSLSS